MINDPRPVSARYAWYVIGLLTLVNVFNYMDRMALAVLAPHIKAELALSDAQLGLLIGFAFAVLYAICGVPIARWADRGVRRNIIALAVGTWSVMTALCGAAQNFWHLFAARVGVGVGEAGGLSPAQSIICDYVPLKRRAGVYALHGFGLYVGMVVGMALAGWFGESIGWRWTFVVLGLPGIGLALLVRLTLREPVRGACDSPMDDTGAVSLVETLKTLWACPTYRRLLLFGAANGFVQAALSQWWPSFYTRVHALSLSSVGLYLGIAIGAGSGIGLLLGGLVANRAAQRNVRLPLVIGVAAISAALPLVLGSLFVAAAPVSLLLVGVTMLLWNLASGAILAATFSVVRPRMRATSGSINVFVISVLGFGLGPFCVGALSDVLAPSIGTQALRYALLAPVSLLPLMAIALYAAARTLPDDLRATGAEI